jgi:hypothetical protein
MNMTSTTRPTIPHGLSDVEMDQYQRDGFVILRDRLTPAQLAPIQAAFEAGVEKQAREWLAAGLITDACQGEGFLTRYGKLREQHAAVHSNSWRRIIVCEGVYRVWQFPQLVGAARSILGDRLYASGTWNGRPRAWGAQVQTIDWHQDAHYLPDYDAADGSVLSMWFPLVPVDERSGCLQVGRGSCHGGYREKVRLPRNGLIGLTDADVAPYETVSCAMVPGDVLVFNELTHHRSVDNVSDRVRWSLDVRFMSADSPAVAKTRRGYLCHDAAHPERVTDYAAWSAQYDYEGEF